MINCYNIPVSGSNSILESKEHLYIGKSDDPILKKGTKFKSFLLIWILCWALLEPLSELRAQDLPDVNGSSMETMQQAFIVILGTVQDGGSPHIACQKKCCAGLFHDNDLDRRVVSLGVVDSETGTKYLFEATPDMTTQMKSLKGYLANPSAETPVGIFLTHAHIGHYTGLMYLGKEAMNADRVKVYSMPKMKSFLENNGPWSQLVTADNISLIEMKNRQQLALTKNLSVTPLLVPHRDEYSETVGYIIKGPEKSALFVPDINKWEQWDLDIVKQIAKVDYAFLDATFFDGDEVNNRDISEIPHPFVIESMGLFKGLSVEEKAKVVFIHFNHTNPLLDPESKASKEVLENGFNIARKGNIYKL